MKGTVESETSSGSSSGGGGGSSFTVTQPEAPTQTTEPEVSAKEELQKKIMALKDKFIIESSQITYPLDESSETFQTLKKLNFKLYNPLSIPIVIEPKTVYNIPKLPNEAQLRSALLKYGFKDIESKLQKISRTEMEAAQIFNTARIFSLTGQAIAPIDGELLLPKIISQPFTLPPKKEYSKDLFVRVPFSKTAQNFSVELTTTNISLASQKITTKPVGFASEVHNDGQFTEIYVTLEPSARTYFIQVEVTQNKSTKFIDFYGPYNIITKKMTIQRYSSIPKGDLQISIFQNSNKIYSKKHLLENN